MVREFTPEERDFSTKIVQNPAFKGPVHAFVEALANEGILKMFIDGDKIVGLNLLLEAKGIEAKRLVTRENYISIFIATILGHILVNLKGKPGEEVTVEDVKKALDEYIDNVCWSKVFEILWGYSFMIADEVYKPAIKAYKKVEEISDKECQMVDDLFRDAFPAEKGLTVPKKRWEVEQKVIRDMFELSQNLSDEYIGEVFGSIQRINKKPISADMREAIDILAISCVEIELFMLALKELNMSEDKTDKELLHCWFENMKAEKRLCIQAYYYLFAHKCFATTLAGNK